MFVGGPSRHGLRERDSDIASKQRTSHRTLANFWLSPVWLGLCGEQGNLQVFKEKCCKVTKVNSLKVMLNVSVYD